MNYSVHALRRGEQVFTSTDLSMVATTTRTGAVETLPLRDVIAVSVYARRGIGYLVIRSRERTFKISSRSYPSPQEQTDQTEEFRDFVQDVHRRIAAANDRVRFRGGAPGISRGGMFVTAVGVGGVVVSGIKGLQTGPMAFVIMLGIVLMVLGGRKAYAPLEIPEKYLP